MIWIYLKLLVATVLIAIPLIVRYFLCSKNNQKTKIDSLPNIMKKNIPRWRKWFLKLLVMGNNCLRRMSVSIKHRHLFRLILIMVMLSVQVVNNKAGQEAYALATAQNDSVNNMLNVNYFDVVLKNLNVSFGLGWFFNNPLANLIAFLLTIIWFNKRLADCILSCIHTTVEVQKAMLIVMCSALFSPNGGGFLFTELLYVFLIASWIYPAFDKQKSHRFYSLKQIKSIRCKG